MQKRILAPLRARFWTTLRGAKEAFKDIPEAKVAAALVVLRSSLRI
jgi:hypothetical protein